MSIGLVSVPFLSMINFSTTCGMGLKGARSITTEITIRTEYGILSRKANRCTSVDLYGNNLKMEQEDFYEIADRKDLIKH